MTVTLKDIADRVGKSVTTVSRALAGYDDVSPATQAEVRRVAAELGYEPNIVAQQLQKQRTDTIALILPTFSPRLTDPFFSEFLAGIGNAAAEYGYDLLVSTRAPGDGEAQAYLKNIRSRRVDGFIIVRTRRQDPRIALLREQEYPFVAFGRMEGDNDFLFVDEDSEAGMRLILAHLVSLGHKRLAYIAAPDHLMFAHYRRQAFVNGLAAYNLAVDPDLIVEGDLSQRSGRHAAEQLLALANPPTAIVACNDLMAMGAMSAAQRQNLVVGQDVSVVGFDDVSLAEHAFPPLTTIHQPIYEIGTLVCQMLIQSLTGETLSERHVILQPSLIVRQSSGPPRG